MPYARHHDVIVCRCSTTVMAILLLPWTAEARSALADSIDLKLRNYSTSVDARGSENSIFIHPTDSRIILEAHNNQANAGVSAWVSQDGGKTWSGDNSSPGGGGGYGDPAAAIRRPTGAEAVRYLVGEVVSDPAGGQRIIFKDSPTSLTWNDTSVVDQTAGATDKNHLAVDNNTTGTGHGYLYAAWARNNEKRLDVIKSTNNGITWTNRTLLDTNDGKADWAVNIQVGRSASYRNHVYAVWGSTGNPGTQVGGLRFTKCTDPDEFTWATPSEIVSLGSRGYGALDTGLSEKTMGANSSATMAVDDAGNIHVVWGQKRADATSDDGEIYWVKSTDEGSTWTSPVRVNQDATTNDQWLPWVSWDDCTNALVVVFFDSRNDNARAETYIAVNYLTQGTSGWIERKVSDESWSGDSSPIRRAGDYIGVAARDGIAYPVWSDDREAEDDSTFKVYTSPIYLWGVDQSSVQRTIVSNGPGLELTVRANWTTNLEATGTDSFVLTSPTDVVYTGTATGSGTSHEVTKTCTCETGTWKYIVKSTRTGFTTRGSDLKTFSVSVCLD